MKPINIAGMRQGRLEAVMPAWKNDRGQVIWMCVCDCLQIRFVAAGAFKAGTYGKSCGCLRIEVSRGRTTAMNVAKRGQPRSEKGKLASQDACKKMNEIRHGKARHVVSDIDPVKLTGVCNQCGKVPLKVMKHRVGLQRDQYLCWVGSLREHDAYANARVMWLCPESLP